MGDRVPVASGIDVARLADTVRPKDDLYRHVNGNWLDTTEIPADKAEYGAFHQLHDDAEKRVRAILEEAAADPAGSPEGGERRKIGDLYADFLDEETVERLGAAPIAGELEQVAGITDVTGLVTALGEMQRGGLSGPFGWWVDTDAKDSDRYVVYLHQGGIGLPDESYYRQDEFAEVREAYLAHVGRMLTLVGTPDAADAARRVLALETRLAAAHWDRVTARDATKAYTLVDRAGLTALTPAFDWDRWLAGLGRSADAAVLAEVVVRQPSFFQALSTALAEVPIDDWKIWLTWRVVHSTASLLSKTFVDENFAFYGTHAHRDAARSASAGSAACRWSRARWARRSARSTSSGTSRRGQGRGWTHWSPT